MVNGDRNKLIYYLCNSRGKADTSCFKNRKVAQKKVYLLQALELNMNYAFGWYLYGPYSPELTVDLYQKTALQYQAPETVAPNVLSDDEKVKLKDLDELLEGIDEKDLDKWLELLASLHMCQTKEKLKERKPNKFSDAEIDAAWERLTKKQLLKVDDH